MLGKISEIISYFQVAWNVLSQVRNLIEVIEEQDVDDGNKYGPEKKNAVINIISSVYDATNDFIEVPVEKEFITNLTDNAIDIFVDIYNVLGRFRSKSTTT